MCNVKQGSNIKTTGDLQNLITSVILRQTSEFSVDDIYNDVRNKLTGSVYYDSPKVKRRCKNTIHTLFIIDCLKSVERDKYLLTMS